jgi:hypothetical protein
VDEVVANNMMESEYVGWGSKSEEYPRFKKIKFKASNDELFKLTQHDNPIVRTYGFLALVDRNKISHAKAFEEALENNQSFSKMSADQILPSSICSEIYFDLWNKASESNPELGILDSLILYKIDSTHFLHYMALNDKIHKPKFNNRIRGLAETYQNHSAILYLDKNGIEIDTIKIIESIEYIVENKFVGSEPKAKLIELSTKLKRKN